MLHRIGIVFFRRFQWDVVWNKRIMIKGTRLDINFWLTKEIFVRRLVRTGPCCIDSIWMNCFHMEGWVQKICFSSQELTAYVYNLIMAFCVCLKPTHLRIQTAEPLLLCWLQSQSGQKCPLFSNWYTFFKCVPLLYYFEWVKHCFQHFFGYITANEHFFMVLGLQTRKMCLKEISRWIVPLAGVEPRAPGLQIPEANHLATSDPFCI